MIRSVTVTNFKGESLKMQLDRPDETGFAITQIDGLGPVTASLSTTEYASADGVKFNSAKLGARNIVLHITFFYNQSIETLRQKTYRYFPTKRKVHLSFEADNRICDTDGIVESNEPDIFSSDESCVISIMCSNPYFVAGGDSGTMVSPLAPSTGFEFPFANNSLTRSMLEFIGLKNNTPYYISYEGDSDTGVLLHILADAPFTNLRITEVLSQKSIFIDTTKISALTEGRGIQRGDEIIISSVTGNKTAMMRLSNGTVINIINCLGRLPGWFKLSNGVNVYSINAATGVDNIKIWFEYQKLYEGI